MSEAAAAPSTPISTPTSSSEGQGRQNSPIQNNLPTPPTQIPAQEDSWDVKVNGKIVKMSRQEALDHASMAYHANSKFNEAKKAEQKVNRIITTAKSNPIEALMDPELGLTKDQIKDAFEAWYSKEYIEPETLTDDQRRANQLETENKQYKEREAQMEAAKKKYFLDQATEKQRESIQHQIIEALDKSNLPKNPDTVRRIAFYMQQAAQQGWEAPMDMIVRQVQAERKTLYREQAENSTAEQLIDLFGETVINKIRQHDLQQLRARRNGVPVNPSNPVSTPATRLGDKIDYTDVAQRLRDLRTGKLS